MHLKSDWREVLQEELQKPYISDIEAFVSGERRQGLEIFPPDEEVFSAFDYTPFNQIKVVIVGQDPYHGPGQAHGLCFSVRPEVSLPPSLKNIYKELSSDLGIPVPQTGCLIPWAKQGVLMLNATLTVRRGQAKSHFRRGWEKFTDAVVAAVARKDDPVAFLLWGRSAQDKYFANRDLNTESKHLVLRSVHPSPLSAYGGFYGSQPFSKINTFLVSKGMDPIDWSLCRQKVPSS